MGVSAAGSFEAALACPLYRWSDVIALEETRDLIASKLKRGSVAALDVKMVLGAA